MAGDPGQIPPPVGPRRGAWRSARGALLMLFGAALIAVLVWRIAAVGFGFHKPAGKTQNPEESGKREKSRTGAVYEAGQSTDGAIRIYDETTGRLVTSLHFRKSVLKGQILVLEDVELKRVLDGDKGVLLARAGHGVYDRATGSGTLSENVRVERTPSGAAAPDLFLRAGSLAWDHAAGVLTSQDFAEMTWVDPRTGRKLTVGGTGLRAERWAETVRLERDVRVSLAEPVLPRLRMSGQAAAGSPLAGEALKEPAITTITCAGPATFENRDALGCRRVLFEREVKAVRRELRSGRQDTELACNRLAVLLNPERGEAGRDGADVSAVGLASAAPSAGALAARGLIASLSFPPEPAAAAAAAADGKPPREQDMIDSVLATGAVVISGPDGTARGELAYYDRPGGCLWLDGGPRDPAEVMRGDDQIVKQSFFFNLRTEEMSTEGLGRARVTVKDSDRLPGLERGK